MTLYNWILAYDWGCTGYSGYSINTYFSNNTLNFVELNGGGSYTATWSLCGDVYTHVYDDYPTTYNGVFSNGMITGTISSESGNTGCFFVY